MLTLPEILGVKKAAIVLKTLANGFQDEGVKNETLALVMCVMSAAVELEAQYYESKAKAKPPANEGEK